MEFLAPYYLWFKALHIISVISWMAGLLYLPRLFVRHAEFGANEELARVFCLMEQKLYRIIMLPAMISTWLFGLLMAASGLTDTASVWFVVKFVLVIALTAFHFWCAVQLKCFRNNQNAYSPRYYRIANEVPTLLMVVVVLLAVVKFV